MSERLKELLEKINQEGVKQAEENARAIESEARAESEKILAAAKKEARKIKEDAQAEARRTRENVEIVLKQASRDLILALKEDIRKTLDKVVNSETARAVSGEEMRGILSRLIEEYVKRDGEVSDIKVLLKKDDLEKLKDTFIAKLKDRFKGGLEFRVSPAIKAGFFISFDKGKSFFDFTDEGLTQALSAYLNPELLKLLK